MTWSSANNSFDRCWFFESLIPVMSCFYHLVIISSTYVYTLNSVGERGRPWCIPLLISAGFDSLLLNFCQYFILCVNIISPSVACLTLAYCTSWKWNIFTEICWNGVFIIYIYLILKFLIGLIKEYIDLDCTEWTALNLLNCSFCITDSERTRIRRKTVASY